MARALVVGDGSSRPVRAALSLSLIRKKAVGPPDQRRVPPPIGVRPKSYRVKALTGPASVGAALVRGRGSSRFGIHAPRAREKRVGPVRSVLFGVL